MTFTARYDIPNPLPPVSDMMDAIARKAWLEANSSPKRRDNRPTLSPHESAVWRRNRPEAMRY